MKRKINLIQLNKEELAKNETIKIIGGDDCTCECTHDCTCDAYGHTVPYDSWSAYYGWGNGYSSTLHSDFMDHIPQ